MASFERSAGRLDSEPVLVRGDGDAQVFLEEVDDGAGAFVADAAGVLLDAGELVHPVVLAGLLFPDREQGELVGRTPVFGRGFDRDRDEEECRVGSVGVPQQGQITQRREARQCLCAVNDAAHPVEGDGPLAPPEPKPAGRNHHLLPAAIDRYTAAIREKHQQLRRPRRAAVNMIGAHLDARRDAQ